MLCKLPNGPFEILTEDEIKSFEKEPELWEVDGDVGHYIMADWTFPYNTHRYTAVAFSLQTPSLFSILLLH